MHGSVLMGVLGDAISRTGRTPALWDESGPVDMPTIHEQLTGAIADLEASALLTRRPARRKVLQREIRSLHSLLAALPQA
jgi:hypothetical protein